MTESKIHDDPDLNFALNLCQEAGEILKYYFYNGVKVSYKTDNSPVTIADKECEAFICQKIFDKYPDDFILAEENYNSYTANLPASFRRWIIDPLDGTYNFMRQIPIFSILLALEIDHRIDLGIIYNPVLNEIYYAKSDLGAYKNDEAIKVSSIDKLDCAMFNFGGVNRILEHNLGQNFNQLVKKTYRQRGFGDYFNFALVFEGKSELALEVGLQPWDLAPMSILAKESGGKFTALSGSDSVFEGNCLVSNNLLHNEALKILSEY